MIKRITAALTSAFAFSTSLWGSGTAAPPTDDTARLKSSSFYQLSAKSLDGTDAPLAEYAGKVTLVVNVASHCGYTPQYEALQKLADEYKDKGLVILAFPSGDFGKQEFDDAKDIREFCETKYHITFPLFEKCRVKADAKGDAKSDAKTDAKSTATQSEIFACLGAKTGELPAWNFAKYVVSRDGKTAVFFPSKVAPDDATFRAAIDAALAVKFPPAAVASPAVPAKPETTKPETTKSETAKPETTKPASAPSS